MALESLPTKLDRVRTAPTHITYDVEIGDSIEMRELPFVIGVLADLSGATSEPVARLRDRKFIEVERDTFDLVLDTVRPHLTLAVSNAFIDDGSKLGVYLSFRSMNDFSPIAIALQIPFISSLLDVRKRLLNLQKTPPGNDQAGEGRENTSAHPQLGDDRAPELTELGELLKHCLASDPFKCQSNADDDSFLVSLWRTLQGISQAETTWSPDIASVIHARLKELDNLLSRQVDSIFHHPDFKSLEATWRGLQYLVSQVEASPRMRVRVLNVNKRQLLRDATIYPGVEQACLFKKVFDEEYGTLGGTPFAALIWDSYFTHLPEDVAILNFISQVAASSHAPFIAAAAPEIFGLQDFGEITRPISVTKLFDFEGFAKWKAFRREESARFTSLVLPRFLLRLPYRNESDPVEDFWYEERVVEHQDYLWGSAAFAFGMTLLHAFERSGWCAAIHGVDGGGRLGGLPAHVFSNYSGDVLMKCPTEATISDRRAAELEQLGFTPLLSVKGTTNAAFLSVISCHDFSEVSNADSGVCEDLPANLDGVFAVSRFAHYLRCVMRDKIGCQMSIQEWSDYLNRWITSYVFTEDTAHSTTEAQFPLRSASVCLEALPDNPQSLRVVLMIQPRFQVASWMPPLRTTILFPKFYS